MKARKSLESRLCWLIMGLLFPLLLAVGHVQLMGQRATLTEEKAYPESVAERHNHGPLTGRGSVTTRWAAHRSLLPSAEEELSCFRGCLEAVQYQ